MRESLGARLRRRRERQGIALTTVAAQTKIAMAHLEALERDDVSHWPPGIFRRAFVRAYALAIGLAPEDVVGEFLACHPDPMDLTSTASGLPDEISQSPTTLRDFVGRAMGSWSWLRGERIDEPTSAFDGATAAARTPVSPPRAEPDLAAAADLCTALGRIDCAVDAAPLLARAVDILDAVGLIVWIWDARTAELTPSLSHGYADAVLAQLPRVPQDADNATAAAFRSGETCVVPSSAVACGAVVVPLMTSAGCVGALAIELPRGEKQASVRAVATMFAGQLARVVSIAHVADARDRRLA